MLSLLAARGSHNSDSDPNNAPSISPVHRRVTSPNEKPALKKQVLYDATTTVMKPLRGSAEDLNIASNRLATPDPHSKLDLTISEHREDPELLGNAHSKIVSGLNSMEGKTTVIKPSTRQLSHDADSSDLGSFLGSWQEVSGSVSRSYRETSLPAHNSQDPGPSSNTSSSPPVLQVRPPFIRGQLSFSSKHLVNSGASTIGLALPPHVASGPRLATTPLLGSADLIASTSQLSWFMSGPGSGGFHIGSTALGTQPSRAALLLGTVPTSMDLVTPTSGLSMLPEVPSTASPVSTRVTKLSSQRTSNLNLDTGGSAQSPTSNAGSPSPRQSRHLMTPSPSSQTIHRDKSSLVHSDSTILQGGESETVNELGSVGLNPDLTSGREALSGYEISAALPKNSVTLLDQEAAGKTESNGLIQVRAYDDNSAVLRLLSGPVKDLLNQASGCQHLEGQLPSGFAATDYQTGQLQGEGSSQDFAKTPQKGEGSSQDFAKTPQKGAGGWSFGDVDRTVDHGVNQDKLVGAVVEGGPSEGMHAPAGAWDVQGVMEGLEKEEEEEEVEEKTIRWHEVQAVPLCDPVTGKEAILLIQNDITARSVIESRMAALTESQLTMLENMFPRHVLEYVVGAASPDATLGDLAYQHEDVTILFMDIVGFTSMSKEVAPHMVMEFLNDLFSKFDELCDQYNVYKVETAGDCYIVAGALMELDEEGFMTLDFHGEAGHGAKNVVDFGQAMLRHARTINTPHNGLPTCVRVGIHTGSVVSGLIGTKLPKFSLFGDTMNTSSRMESTSKPGCIQISQATYSMLGQDQQALFLPSGGVEVKGKGLMATYLYTPSELDLELRPEDVSTLGLVTSALMSEAQADGAQVMDEELIQDLELSHDNYAGTSSRMVIADGMNKLPVPQQTWVPENRLDIVPEASIAPLPGMPVLTSGTALDLSNRKALAFSEASTQALESLPVSRAAGSELEYNLCKAPSASLSLDVSPRNIPAGAEEGKYHASVRKMPMVSEQVRLEEDIAAVEWINNEIPGQVLALPVSGRRGDDNVTPASSFVERNVGGRRMLSTRAMEIQQGNHSGSLTHTLGTPAGAVGYKLQPGTGSSSGRLVGSSTTGGSTPGPISFVEAEASFASTQKLIAEASDQGTGNLSQEGVIGKSPKNKLAMLRMGGTMRRAPRKVASSVALKPSFSASSCKAADAEETSITFLPTPDASFNQEEESSGSHDIAFPAMSGRMKGNGRSIVMSTGPMDSKGKKVSAVRRFSSLAPPRLASAGSPKVALLDGLGSPVGNPLHDAADTSKPFGSWHFKHALAVASPRRRSLDLVCERFEKMARAEFKDAKNVVVGSSLESIIMGSQCSTDEAVRNVAASGTSGATEPGGQLVVPAAAASGGNGKVASRRRPSSLLMLQKMIHLISDTPPSEFGE
ncbi:hypothetical protein CEUSTIGMA_g2046.t1 [Chlamydomonas eustigma]|uniref:Guanylate cyclase domain-containing protein n=1 Tax=Chlamydomonas eustigma TaxID=1157962 RepID=A0A250WUU9_9CHLO|nr:hypothetical protein CEUSTIGMA_g2046.t1 [Chlamydomonas eustigma]|eukprot:GAX74598.1 hypothetical protein CEUSTIGMA_g2046.t1 [Chlamydomonas eustigma]